MSQVEYEQLAEYYDLINERFIDYDAQARLALSMVQQLGPRPHMILDIACATGQHSARLLRAGHQAAGVDLSEALLEQAARRLRKAGQERPWLVCADMRALPFQQAFEVALCLNHTINYMLSRDLETALRQVRRILKPDGLFLLDFFDYGDPKDWNAMWKEELSAGDLQFVMRHFQSVDKSGLAAVDSHTYELTCKGYTTLFRGEDWLRITRTDFMLDALRSAGFKPLKWGTQKELGAGQGEYSVLVVSRKLR